MATTEPTCGRKRIDLFDTDTVCVDLLSGLELEEYLNWLDTQPGLEFEWLAERHLVGTEPYSILQPMCEWNRPIYGDLVCVIKWWTRR